MLRCPRDPFTNASLVGRRRPHTSELAFKLKSSRQATRTFSALITSPASMGYWLVKTEPDVWGWEHQDKRGGKSEWDGVRNFAAQLHMKSMKLGDLAFFYHTGKEKAVVGIIRVTREWYPEPGPAGEERTKAGELKFGQVDFEAVREFPQPVTLKQMKAVKEKLPTFLLFTQGRLSVLPVSAANWAVVCSMGGLEEEEDGSKAAGFRDTDSAAGAADAASVPPVSPEEVLAKEDAGQKRRGAKGTGAKGASEASRSVVRAGKKPGQQAEKAAAAKAEVAETSQAAEAAPKMSGRKGVVQKGQRKRTKLEGVEGKAGAGEDSAALVEEKGSAAPRRGQRRKAYE
eukprot:TRINITY_DN23482_c0_g1_i1.p1 TRINITY_DN23482_c0_g1~~TRINITY_DN23482_c0_g1_i1.p1  ORF type:complete len:343 (-),score=59.35 TRINITY_DN23482_c0_g1_i1:22-1050(-)